MPAVSSPRLAIFSDWILPHLADELNVFAAFVFGIGFQVGLPYGRSLFLPGYRPGLLHAHKTIGYHAQQKCPQGIGPPGAVPGWQYLKGIAGFTALQAEGVDGPYPEGIIARGQVGVFFLVFMGPCRPAFVKSTQEGSGTAGYPSPRSWWRQS
jgi:hypothetical protein